MARVEVVFLCVRRVSGWRGGEAAREEGGGEQDGPCRAYMRGETPEEEGHWLTSVLVGSLWLCVRRTCATWPMDHRAQEKLLRKSRGLVRCNWGSG